tara:strand:+ start:39 stop:506 length:468 start_codon:yes stop_codon:yes gene_type:complete
MTLAFIENNSITRYPCGAQDVLKAFPNVSFALPLEGQDLGEFGVVTVTPTPQPDFDSSTHYLEEGTPEFSNNEWRQTWKSVAFTDEQLSQQQTVATANARAQRDELLAQSDWTVLADSPLSSDKKTEWQTYRQSLRNIPESSGFPNDITWPTKPS